MTTSDPHGGSHASVPFDGLGFEGLEAWQLTQLCRGQRKPRLSNTISRNLRAQASWWTFLRCYARQHRTSVLLSLHTKHEGAPEALSPQVSLRSGQRERPRQGRWNTLHQGPWHSPRLPFFSTT